MASTQQLNDSNSPVTSVPSSKNEKPLGQINSTNINPDDKPPRVIHGVKWTIAYTSILSSTFLFALDNTVVANIQPAIINQFGQIEDLPWAEVNILNRGKAYGTFNIKTLYISSIVIFEIGSAICGAAKTMDMMIVGRVIAGLGGNGMYTGCLTYIAVMTSTRERPLYMSGVTVLWGGGTVLGPLVGGAFAESSATWRWAFYINLVIGAIFAPTLVWILPSIALKNDVPVLQKLRTMDWLGIAIFFAGATCFTMAINFGGTLYAWSSSPEIVFWVFTGILLIAFILVSHYHPFAASENRLYPLHFYRTFELANLQLQILLVSGIILTTAYYVPLYFQFARGDDAMQAAVRLLPFVLTLVFASLYTNTTTTPVANIYGYTVLMGLGSGAYLMAGFNVVEKLVGPNELSNAVSFMAIAQDIGLILLLALSGSIYQNTTKTALVPLLTSSPSSTSSETDVELLLAGTSNAAFRDLQPESLKVDVVREVTKGIGGVWALLMAASAVSLLAGVFLGNGNVYGREKRGGNGDNSIGRFEGEERKGDEGV
ncbi:MAG: hypothetical protein L6R40_007195 [Gallowayella cf. fulva]|nr:MAG: hypothetical protein L6R40_007195 [Xanthomendoza cf. fulva]